MSTWTINYQQLDVVRERVAKTNTRATKRGFTGRLNLTETPVIKTEVIANPIPGFKPTVIETPMVEVTISGEPPCYNGWDFLAAVEALPSGAGTSTNFVLHAAPGAVITTADRDNLGDGTCDHCQTNRRRIHTYLVRNVETGESKQVGKTCLKDFLGWDVTPPFYSVEDLVDDDWFAPASSNGGLDVTPETVVVLAWTFSRAYGWKPRTFGSDSTADTVESFLGEPHHKRAEILADVHKVAKLTDDPADKGRQIIDYLVTALADDQSEYAYNLLAAITAAVVTRRTMGLVVSAVSAYERAQGREAEYLRRRREHADAAASSRYAGEEGDKIEVTGTVTRLLPIENNYGYNPPPKMMVIVSGGPTVAVTFTTAQWAFEVEQGDAITIKGTVSKHEERDGVKQTVLKRPSLVAKVNA